MYRNIFLNSDDAYKAIITMHPLIGDRSLSLLLASRDAAYQLSDVASCYRFSHITEGRSTAAVAYIHNTSRIREDYDYTKKLEVYALQMLEVDGGFSMHKKSLSVSTVWAIPKHPNTEGLQITTRILRGGQPLDYLFALPTGALHKLGGKHKQGSRLYV